MKSRGKNTLKFIFFASFFLAGIAIALVLWDKITLPYENPWGVTGPLTVLKYNPFNNSLRFTVLVLLPCLILFFVYLINIRNINNLFFGKITIPKALRVVSIFKLKSTWFTIFFAVLFAISSPTYHASGEFDSFHEGESLGAGITYLNGGVPYKDFIFCHGIYQDPLRSVVAFSLFGQSIGSVRTLQSIVKIITFILLAVFILRIFNGNYLHAFLTLFFLVFLTSSSRLEMLIPDLPNFVIIIPRDSIIFTFLLIAVYLKDIITGKRVSSLQFFIINFLFAFIPVLALTYSIERGVYLLLMFIIISPFLYFLFFHKSKFRINYLTSTSLGFLAAIFLLLIVLRGNFIAFFEYAFLTLPNYHELLDGFKYPIFDIYYLMIGVLIALNAYWLVIQFLREIYIAKNKTIAFRHFFEKYFIEFCLLLLSILLFRSALSRADFEHVAYSSILTYLFSFYIFLKYYFPKKLIQQKKIYSYSIIFITILTSILFVYRIQKNDLLVENFPLHIADSHFIPENYKATISYLKQNMDGNDEFITMTSEASWYYFIYKPSPTRFPVVWFASPDFYQNEMVEDLKRSNVKFVLYRNSYWSNAIDGFDNETRLPIIINYLKQNFVFHKKIDDNEIWIKKQKEGQLQNL